MQKITTITANIHSQVVANKDIAKTKELGLTVKPFAEVIFIYESGKSYQLKDLLEVGKSEYLGTPKFDETRLIFDYEKVLATIEYFNQLKEQMEKIQEAIMFTIENGTVQ